MAATSMAAPLLRGGHKVGALVSGRAADFVIFDGNPLIDVSILQDRERLKEVYIGGQPAQMRVPDYDPRKVSDFSFNHWNDLYTRERVAELSVLNLSR